MAADGVTVFVTTHYLDEAEYCHRLALIHAGRLVALGTVSELKRVFAGNAVLEVTAPGSARPSRRSAPQPWALETSVFGTRIHVVVRDAGEGREAIERTLAAPRTRRPRSSDPAVARGRLHPPRRGGRGAAARGGPVRRLLAVVAKEVRQVRRDPFSLIMLIGLPAFMLVLYGYALNFDVRHVRLAVQDRDRSAASRELVASFTHSTYFDLVASPLPGESLEALLERRVARAVLVVPEGYGRDLAAGRAAPIQLLLDGADSTTAQTVPRVRPRPRLRAERVDRGLGAGGAGQAAAPPLASSRASSSTRSSSRPSSWCPASSASC